MAQTATQMTSKEIFQRIQGVLEYALNADQEDVTLSAKVVRDLGAESIDFLDIVFRTEQAFDRKFQFVREQSDYPPHMILDQYIEKGFELTGKSAEDGIFKLKNAFESALPFPFEVPSDAENVGDFITVELLCKDVAHRLGIPWSPEELPA